MSHGNRVELLAGAPVLVVGDVMLDHYIYGAVQRISPEAPIPVLSVKRETRMLGGAGNVARNLHALGAHVHCLSIAGDDAAGDTIAQLLDEMPDAEHRLVREPGRRSTVKTRYVAQGQQLLRADSETVAGVSDEAWDALLTTFCEWLPRCRAVLLSDYAKGVLSGARAGSLLELTREAGIPSVVDPKGHDFQRYAQATVIKPNLRELSDATRMSVESSEAIDRAARHLLQECACEYILVTRGGDGMTLVGRAGPPVHWPSQAREVFDVSGAGDTVAATLAAALAARLTLEEAVALANCAAGVVVGKLGTATATREELRAAVSGIASS